MTSTWIAILVLGGAMVITAWTSWRRRVEMAELGRVSEQWLAEQRASEHSTRNGDR